MGAYIGDSDDAKTLLALLNAGRKTQVPSILWGPPGSGKTDIVRALARLNNLPLFILLASTMDPTDINGLPAIKRIIIERPQPDGSMTREEITVTEPTLQYWAEALIREGKGILFFDEANNAVPAVQSTLLSVLQGRIVGRHVLPDEVWMIAASNETADAADGWELAPPMANRFLHINYSPNLEDWYNGMLLNWGKEVPPSDTAEYQEFLALQQQRSEIAGYIKQNPSQLLDMPKLSSEAGKAWPSPRSWDAAARILTHIPKGEKTQGVRYLALQGLVGKAAAVSYEKYEKGLKLPPYETILENPTKVNWKALSAAETRLILDIVTLNISPDNYEASFQVFGAVTDIGERQDIAAAMTKPLLKSIRQFTKTKQIDIAKLLPIIQRYAPFLKEAQIK
jgi:MoxR-like ATPase